MEQVAGNGVTLNFLHQSKVLLAFDDQLDQSVLLAADGQEELVTGEINVEGGIAVSVKNTGNQACATCATCCTLTKFATGLCDQRGVAHESLLQIVHSTHRR